LLRSVLVRPRVKKHSRVFRIARGASQAGTVIVAVQYNDIDGRLHGENGRNLSQKPMFLL
jgi:hypothetical protein